MPCRDLCKVEQAVDIDVFQHGIGQPVEDLFETRVFFGDHESQMPVGDLEPGVPRQVAEDRDVLDAPRRRLKWRSDATRLKMTPARGAPRIRASRPQSLKPLTMGPALSAMP